MKILFIGDSAQQPVLSDVVVRYGVSVNILHGKIEYIGHRALGILVVLLTHPTDSEQLAAAIHYVQTRTARVEVLHG